MQGQGDLGRRNDIDWLRVLATGIVFLFHCARFFNPEDWHVKNNELSEAMGIFVGVVGQWMMPLFFILSAIAARYSLRNRSGGRFLMERLKRLGIPFLFGTLVLLIPIQVYIERVSHGDYSGGFLSFYPLYFDGWYAFGGNFAWMGLHLWYLEMLLLFSVITLPIMLWLNRASVSAFIDRLFKRLHPIAGFLIPAIAIGLIEMIVNQHPNTIGRRDFGGWSLVTYLVIFLLGYIFCTRATYFEKLKSYRRITLVSGMLATSAGLYLVFITGFSTYSIEFSILRGFNTWSWLCTILGYAGSLLTSRNRHIAKAGNAVMPFYILHQTLIVMVGFWIREWSLPIPIKFVILCVVAFLLILSIYEMVIRRTRVLRFLFGMKEEPPRMEKQHPGLNYVSGGIYGSIWWIN